MGAEYISKILFDQNNLSKNSYLKKIPIINCLMQQKQFEFSKNVSFFIGENGSGKSTLIEAIAVASGFNPEGGSKNFTFSTRDTNYELADCLTIVRRAYPKDGFFFRAESFYNVASNIEEIGVTGYGDISLHEQSHGESFLSLFQNRFKGQGLYILDEPEAALSPLHQLTLLSLIHKLALKNSQFIIATHSPILISYQNADVYQINRGEINKVSYKDSEIYKLYFQFLNNPEQIMNYLLENI